jgi:hypothetical protein
MVPATVSIPGRKRRKEERGRRQGEKGKKEEQKGERKGGRKFLHFPIENSNNNNTTHTHTHTHTSQSKELGSGTRKFHFQEELGQGPAQFKAYLKPHLLFQAVQISQHTTICPPS